MSNNLPKNYRCKSLTSKLLATIPNEIFVYVQAPFESVIYNKYYLMLCRHLHPKTNIICVHNGDRYVPVNSRESFMLYLGMLSSVAYRKFINAAMDINLLFMIEAYNDKRYYVINPVFATNRRVNFNAISTFFSIISSFGNAVTIDEKYVEDIIKPESDKRVDRW